MRDMYGNPWKAFMERVCSSHYRCAYPVTFGRRIHSTGRKRTQSQTGRRLWSITATMAANTNLVVIGELAWTAKRYRRLSSAAISHAHDPYLAPPGEANALRFVLCCLLFRRWCACAVYFCFGADAFGAVYFFGADWCWRLLFVAHCQCVDSRQRPS